MNGLINAYVKTTALAQMVAGVRCAWPYIQSGLPVPEGCREILRFFFDIKYFYHYGIEEMHDLFEIDPEDIPWPPNKPRPDPSPIAERLELHEDVLFTLASLMTEPLGGENNINSLLRDPQLNLESARRVQEALENSHNRLAEEITRLEELSG